MLVPAPLCCLPLNEPDIISLLPVTTGMSAAPALPGSMQSTNCLCLTQAPHVTPASPTLPCPAGRVQHQAAREGIGKIKPLFPRAHPPASPRLAPVSLLAVPLSHPSPPAVGERGR